MNQMDVAIVTPSSFLPTRICQWCYKEFSETDTKSTFDEYIIMCRDCWFRYVTD